MCVAIVTPKGKRVPVDRLQAGWHINRDGAGFAYVRKNKVEIKKGFMDYPRFEKAYLDACEKYADTSPFLIHMRIRTSGYTDKDNTHPFKVKGGAMIHNGNLFTPTVADDIEYKGFSDTRIFAARLHNVLTKQDVIIGKEKIEAAIHRWNKLAFLYDDGEYVILNEAEGNWHDGVWYSNRTCNVWPRRQTTGSVTPSAR